MDFVYDDEAVEAATRGQEVFDLRLAGFRYAVGSAEGFSGEITQVFGLDRLKGINQFGCTTAPVPMDFRPRGTKTAPVFPHTRFTHVHDVAAIAQRIAAQNGLDERTQQLLSVAALSHDALMPAGGDTIKEIDQETYDEDKHYPRLFLRTGWLPFARTYGLDENVLAATIRNEGMLGELLDWADKIGYTARDVDEYLKLVPPDTGSGYGQAIRELVELFPTVCEVWRSLRIVDGRVASDAPDVLGRFLRLRTLMFREIYYGETTRFARIMLSSATRVLLARGHVSAQKLVLMTDEDLDDLIRELTGVSVLAGFDSATMGEPGKMCVANEMAAITLAKDHLVENGNPFTQSINRREFVKPRLDLPVLVGKKAVPFRDACPDVAREIELLARDGPPIIFYWLEKPSNPSVFVRELADLRRKELDEAEHAFRRAHSPAA